MIPSEKKKEWLWIGLLVFVAAVTFWMNTLNLREYTFWVDEIVTVSMVPRGFRGMAKATMNDVHPPLYYALVILAGMLFGNTAVVYRAVSIVPLLILDGVAIGSIRKRFGNSTALLFILMASLSEQALNYNAEARMYSWAGLFVTLAGYGIYLILKENRKRDWILLVINGILTAYTQYFALVTVALLYMALLVILLVQKKRVLPWFVSVGLSAVAFMPWLIPYLGKLGGKVSNFALYSSESLPMTMRMFFSDNIVGKITAVVFVATTAGYLWQNRKHLKNTDNLLLLLALTGVAGTILVGYGISILIRPVWVSRYLYPALGLYWLAFSYMLPRAMKKSSWGLCAALVFSALLFYRGVKTERELYHTAVDVNEHIYLVQRFVEEHYQPGDRGVTLWDYRVSNGALEFYLPQLELVNASNEESWLDGSTGVFMVAPEWQKLPEEWTEKFEKAGIEVADWGSGKLANNYIYIFYLTPKK